MKKVSRLTYADLEQLPDDGNRYELIEGELYVTSAPSWPHQRAVRNLFKILDPVCPEDLEIIFAPFEWHAVDYDECYQPDLLIARLEDRTEKNLPRPPVLVAEVLSRSTRSRDLVLKRRTYARSGVDHYWIVDTKVPSITVLERTDDRFEECSTVKDDELLVVDRPFPVSLRATDLVEQRLPR